LPSHTTLPFASTMQTEIVLSDTSNPTYSAISLSSVDWGVRPQFDGSSEAPAGASGATSRSILRR
jgi:hypothetical protein